MKKHSLWFMMALLIVFVTQPMFAGGEQEDGTFLIKYAHNQKIGSPQDEGVNIFKNKVEELSGGRIKVEVYPDNQLGSLREVIESVQGGQIEMAQQPLGMIANFVPVLNINDLPYLYPSEEVLWKVLDGEMGDKLSAAMLDNNFVNVGYHSGGPKQFSANIPLRTPEDFSKVKLRAMPAPIIIATFEAFGATAVPIEFSELYNSLQQGVVDGQENPMQTVSMLKLYEVQDYVSYTNHSWMIYANIINKQFWDTLPSDIQDIIYEAMAYAAPLQRELMREAEEDYIKETEANGCKVIFLTDEEKEVLTKRAKVVHEKFAPEIGIDFYNEYVEAVESLQ